MYRWKSDNGYGVFWYNHKNYIYNSNRRVTGAGSYVTFTHWWSDEAAMNIKKGFLIGDDFDASGYYNNFVTTIPQDATLYFNKNVTFPRAKLKLANMKRVLKPETADVIVLEESAEVVRTMYSYLIFTDTVYIYAINDQWFNEDFSNNFEELINNKNLGLSFHGPITILFHGKPQIIYDKADTIKNFINNEYNKPFILTTDLDRIINQNLPDLNLNAMNAIYEMLSSTDQTIVNLGATMASTFNVNKWILSTTVLMYQNTSWFYCNTVTVKQLKRTLGLMRYVAGWWSIASEVQTRSEEYSKEDILLAQEFVKGKPGFKEFCEQNKGFYLDFLPYIPDEYKE